MASVRRPLAPPAQVVDLLLMELTNWRWSWRSMLVTATLTPLASMLMLGAFARETDVTALAYILSGNMVLSLMFGIMENVQSHFVFMRFRGTLDYFATLPIRRYALVMAVVLAFLLLSLPSLLVTALGGALILDVPLRPHPVLLLVVPLCAISLAGIGAFIGIRARTPQEAGSLALILSLLLSGPVILPPGRLPAFVHRLMMITPAPYAASAFRQALLGPVTARVLLDLAVLAAMSFVMYALVDRAMDWRQ